MPISENYRKQVALLVRILPVIAQEDCFALKGGTAINLFIRDMPRLSVDVDLTYLPVAPRPESLTEIDAAMKRIARGVKAAIPGSQINSSGVEGAITKLTVRQAGVQIKIEVTPVLRGCVFDPSLRAVSPGVEAVFGFAEMPVVSFADLYAGKMVAALDRQHPRDLFDVRGLLANEGVSEALRTAFIVYLLSHDRPMAEVLAPARKDIGQEFLRGFEGMTSEPVSLDKLVAVREALIAEIVTKMPEAHRRFLAGVHRGRPDWALLGAVGADELPAVKWRLQNLDKLTDARRMELAAAVEAVWAA